MSDDLIRRLRSGEWVRRGPEISREAADRIEADAALLRQALDAMQVAARCDMWPEEERQQDAVIAALRARLGETT